MRLLHTLGLLLALSAPASAQVSKPVVHVRQGQVSGVISGDVVSFKGLPYAAPPVGDLRWRAPRPAPSWTGVRVADHFSDICLQADDKAEPFATPPTSSEDCLYLNVWRPAGPARNLPVMVWIHGGGLTNGAASVPVYDGAAFARRGVVLVSFNYRVGRFGFFAHPALTQRAADGGPVGNYGLMDQIAALKWVAANIKAFGGDPSKVTVFGESAGAQSIDVLMTVPGARGLFRGAIVQSGYGRGAFPRLSTVSPDGKRSAEDDGVALMKDLGVETDNPAVLRAVPAADLKAKARYDFGFGFIRDGRLVTGDLWSEFRAGREAAVPLIIGSNSLETPPPPPQYRALLEAVARRYVEPQDKPALAKAYGGQDQLDLHLSSDLGFGAQARSLALLHRANGHPAYVYRFSAVAASVADKLQGAPHASELPYVFNTLSKGRWAMAARDQALADSMIRYWVAFARTGRPQVPDLPAWPVADGRRIMIFGDDGPAPGIDARTDRYKALSAVADPRS